MMKEASSSNKTQFDILHCEEASSIYFTQKIPIKADEMMEVKRWVTDKKPGYVCLHSKQ